MQVYDRTTLSLKKNPTTLIYNLVQSIPKRMVPRMGFPNFHLTHTLLHSYAVMYERYDSVKNKREQEAFVKYLSTNVWAFTAFRREQEGDVYLALETRLDGKTTYYRPLEFSILHEIGHHWLFGRGEQGPADDLQSENFADDYAMACFLHYAITKDIKQGYFQSFHPIWKEAIKMARSKGLNGVNLLRVGEEVMAWCRIRSIQYGI